MSPDALRVGIPTPASGTSGLIHIEQGHIDNERYDKGYFYHRLTTRNEPCQPQDIHNYVDRVYDSGYGMGRLDPSNLEVRNAPKKEAVSGTPGLILGDSG